MKINFTKLFSFLSTILPVLGVIFLDWNAFEMLFIYLSESAILSFFALMRRNRIIKHRIDSNDRSYQGSSTTYPPFFVFFIFGFFYFFLLGMSSMAKAIPFPEFQFDLLSFGKILIAPIIQSPQILFLIIGTVIGNALMYSNFLRKKEYIEPKDRNPELIFGKNVLSMFGIICLSFPLFWSATVISSIFNVHSLKFVNIIMALVLVLVLNIRDVYYGLTGKKRN